MATGGALADQIKEENDEVQLLNAALDTLADTKQPFLNKYMVTYDAKRLSGGQGIVQFVQLRGTSQEYVIKFFTWRPAFQWERELYKNPTLKSMMPATQELVGNEDGSVRVGHFVMPPCIVLEAGESLQTWMRREDRDLVTTFQVRASHLRASEFGVFFLFCGDMRSNYTDCIVVFQGTEYNE
jgi:hypothetical protein